MCLLWDLGGSVSREEILKKAITKAVENGFNNGLSSTYSDEDKVKMIWNIALNHPFQIIYNHWFAKAFFGEEWVDDSGWTEKMDIEYRKTRTEEMIKNIQLRDWRKHEIAWEYHLQNMVISEDPLAYLEKYL